MYYSASYDSPLGRLTLAAFDGSLTGLWIEGQKYFGAKIEDDLTFKEDYPVFAIIKKWLDDYFAGKKPSITTLPLAPIGSGFRQEVWKILLQIPYGGVITYGDIAKQIALKQNKKNFSAQAVGGAVGHNPISIIIPCHRVIGANNSLTGYAGGLDLKRRLLSHEGIEISIFKK